MTKIIFYKKNTFLTGFEISGHTGYAEEGNDIVCSAVSSMSQMIVLGLKQILKLKPMVKKDDKKGYLFCKVFEENEILKAQDMLNMLKLSLEKLVKNFKKYLKLEVKDEVN